MPSVGTTIPHDSAHGHVTGAALFLDDVTPVEGELLVSFVGSPVACGTLKTIDVKAAKQIPGVAAIFTADDLPGENQIGAVFRDEPFLAERELLFVGQPLAVVAAETREALAAARRAIRVQTKAGEPILSIDAAVVHEKFIGPARRIARGDAQTAMESAPHVLSGTFRVGGQEQFYLESQAAIAYPGEGGQVVVHSSTQNPSQIQTAVAEVLGVGHHQVVCICKRMGGAFGGKETQAASPAAMAALVAHKTGRSARVIYNKDDDMCVTGKRHAFRADWQVGFDDAGRIEAYTVDFFSDGGSAADLSLAVMERAMLHADNTFYLPNVTLQGRVCFTNFPPNTAFRGFGGPQGMATIENAIESIAIELGLDAYDVRQRNLYGTSDRNITPYHQRVARNHLPQIFTALAESSQYRSRRKAVERFNAQSRLQLRGLAMTGVKFGISFTTRFMNQANALVNIYNDGTVQVSTGGTEMGQGLNTKIKQLVADEFAIDPADVQLMSTSTEKNNNTSPTAASASTDLNGAAAVKACGQIKRRLVRFAAELLASADDGLTAEPANIAFDAGHVHDVRRPEVRIPFGDLVAQARRQRVNLGARGFHATPGVDYNRETGRGSPFFYYTQGAAVAEVLIDQFTGDLRIPRVDLLIDIGRPINPGVELGQITGGFIQGQGWVTTEALVYDDAGGLLSHSPTTYKIPAITDVPEIFNCALLDNADNIQNIRASKAAGEPPLMLGISVWAAVKNALSYLAPGSSIELGLPATGEEILKCMTSPVGATARHLI